MIRAWSALPRARCNGEDTGVQGGRGEVATREGKRRNPAEALPTGRRLIRSRGPIAPAPLITEGSASAATTLREGVYRRSLAVADAIVAASLLGVALPLLVGAAPELAVVGVPLIVFLCKLARLYERDDLVLKKTTLDEAPAVLQIAGLFTFLMWLLLDGATGTELDASEVALSWLGVSTAMLVGRGFARALAGRVSPPERCLMIGESSSARAVAQKLAGAGVNAEIVAALEVDAQGRLLQAADLEEAFCELVRRHDVHRVIIAPAAGGSEAPLSLIRTAKHAGVRISVVPRMMEVVGSSVEFDYLDGLTMLGVRRFGLTLSSRLVKRAFDLVGSTVLLVAVAPLGLMAALAIRLDSRGPVLFRQTRVGKDGRRFRMFKFRSMVDGAEEIKDNLRHLNNVEGLFKLEDDPRVTRIGRVLRRVSLDELPQLLNVWRGEMSLVGPRPLVLDEDALVQGLDRYRLHLKPGMTGYWQILGATRVPLHEMVGIDYLYVANWSLWTDVKILLRTVPHVLASRGV